jgi:hypothetical protein
MARLPWADGFESLDKHLGQIESALEKRNRLDNAIGWSIVPQWEELSLAILLCSDDTLQLIPYSLGAPVPFHVLS